jgi:hypothetical protein
MNSLIHITASSGIEIAPVEEEYENLSPGFSFVKI